MKKKIAKDNDSIPLPEWQKKELDQRYLDYKQGKANLNDWKETHIRLRDKYKSNFA